MDDQVGSKDPNAFDRLTLRFRDPDLEARYRADRADGDLRQFRLAVLVGAVINASFPPLDYLVVNEGLLLTLILRVGVATLGFLSAFGLSFVPGLRRKLAYPAAFAVSSFTVVYIAINALSDSPDLYLSGFILVILFVLVFVPVGFVIASAITLSNTLLFAALIPVTRDIALGALLTVYSQFMAANLMGMFALYWMERLQRLGFLNLRQIADERSRYHELLTRILPRGIVKRLDHGEGSVADDFADCTVLFADIVGFTEAAARQKPAELVAFLNQVFERFDALVERHHVEKIKTIGDAYMAAGGLPEKRPGHAEAIADLALDMMAETAKMTWPDGAPLNVRIGIHAGPLIAGVIGRSRFLYDVWGDTVNTASRMERLGAPGRIQVSDATYRRLSADYSFEPHGEIEVKGKGRMTTWHLTGRRSAAPSATA